MSKDFRRTKEDFICGNCSTTALGNGYTNHCPKCLWSKHVDITPGDRASDCGGMMKPQSVVLAKGIYRITHRCLTCGYEKINDAGPGDNLEQYFLISDIITP